MKTVCKNCKLDRENYLLVIKSFVVIAYTKSNCESILIKTTYTYINLNNSMKSYISCFYLTYCKSPVDAQAQPDDFKCSF